MEFTGDRLITCIKKVMPKMFPFDDVIMNWPRYNNTALYVIVKLVPCIDVIFYKHFNAYSVEIPLQLPTQVI